MGRVVWTACLVFAGKSMDFYEKEGCETILFHYLSQYIKSITRETDNIPGTLITNSYI